MTQCSVSCKGFLSVRAECARDPCLAMGDMCRILHPNEGDCASWCCVNRAGYVFFMVLFFGLGTFALCAAYYVHRLHQINVAAGAVTVSGEICETPDEPEEPQVVRTKREVRVDPKLISSLEEEE